MTSIYLEGRKYASFLRFCAPCIWTFLNSPLKTRFSTVPLRIYLFPEAVMTYRPAELSING